MNEQLVESTYLSLQPGIYQAEDGQRQGNCGGQDKSGSLRCRFAVGLLLPFSVIAQAVITARSLSLRLPLSFHITICRLRTR